MGFERLVRDLIERFRSENALHGEFKWTKVSNWHLENYKRFVSVFFDIRALHYNCIVVDKHILDYKAYHQNDKELAFYKFYFQLLSRKIVPDNLYWVYPDKKPNRKNARLDDLMSTVNRWCLKQHGRAPMRHIEARSSNKDDLIQMADVLSGAVQCAYNGITRSKAKLGLLRFITKKCKFATLKVETAPNKRPINIWRWKPLEK